MQPYNNLEQDNLSNYLGSQEYLLDAQKWYKQKYIYPLIHRSLLFLICILMFLLLIILLLCINFMLPLTTKIQYSVLTPNNIEQNAHITKPNLINGSIETGIAELLIRNYVKSRESYSYKDLKKQFNLVRNNSTRIIFRRFYNFMNIDNPNSPIMKYQKDFTRNIKISSVTHPSYETVVVDFESKLLNLSEEVVETSSWKATISYEMDKITDSLPVNSKFNFTVVDYQLKLISKKEA